MRRAFIAGNWKMNLSRVEAAALAGALAQAVGSDSPVQIAVCPPFVYLDAVAQAIKGSAVALGAQNMYHEKEGAFTGEISAGMLLDLGCEFVILGHSERRHILGESNEDVNQKVLAALKAGLTPIVCVGETLPQREANETKQVVQEQVEGSLKGLSNEDAAKIVIAYEPVWAIGTGKTASPEQAEEVHCDLRNLLQTLYNAEVASQICIQYGGSVKPDNADKLLAKPNIDGALVGGASLDSKNFMGIVAGVK